MEDNNPKKPATVAPVDRDAQPESVDKTHQTIAAKDGINAGEQEKEH